MQQNHTTEVHETGSFDTNINQFNVAQLKDF